MKNWQLLLPLSRRKPGPMTWRPRTSHAIAVAYRRPQARAAERSTPAFAGKTNGSVAADSFPASALFALLLLIRSKTPGRSLPPPKAGSARSTSSDGGGASTREVARPIRPKCPAHPAPPVFCGVTSSFARPCRHRSRKCCTAPGSRPPSRPAPKDAITAICRGPGLAERRNALSLSALRPLWTSSGGSRPADPPSPLLQKAWRE